MALCSLKHSEKRLAPLKSQSAATKGWQCEQQVLGLLGAWYLEWPLLHGESRSGQAILEAAFGGCAAGANLVGLQRSQAWSAEA